MADLPVKSSVVDMMKEMILYQVVKKTETQPELMQQLMQHRRKLSAQKFENLFISFLMDKVALLSNPKTQAKNIHLTHEPCKLKSIKNG